MNSSADALYRFAGTAHRGVPKGILLYRSWREHLVRTLHRDGGDTGEVAATSTSQISRSLLIDNAFTLPTASEGVQDVRRLMS